MMTDRHDQAFFGKHVAHIYATSAKNQPALWVNCIRKKQDGSWEKKENGEGRNIKINIAEMIQIYAVLDVQVEEWKTVHKFKGNDTQISFKWDDAEIPALWVNFADYSKKMMEPQITLLKFLFKHLIEEKIEFATNQSYKFAQAKKKAQNEQQNNAQPSAGQQNQQFKPASQYQNSGNNTRDNGSAVVSARIQRESQKALFLAFPDGKESWIPKSQIVGGFNSNSTQFQNIELKNWIIQQNNIRV